MGWTKNKLEDDTYAIESQVGRARPAQRVGRVRGWVALRDSSPGRAVRRVELWSVKYSHCVSSVLWSKLCRNGGQSCPTVRMRRFLRRTHIRAGYPRSVAMLLGLLPMLVESNLARERRQFVCLYTADRYSL